MNIFAAAQAGAALCVVVALVLLAGRVARRRWPGAARPPEPGALRLRATLSLDARRRVHLLDAPGGAVLILTGGPNDALLTLPPDCALRAERAP